MSEAPPSLSRLQQAAGSAGAEATRAFNEAVRPHLPALKRYVHRELAWLRARRDLDPDDPSADDVIDETLARAWRELNERPQIHPGRSWLYRFADGVMSDAVRDRRRRGRLVSLDKRLPEARLLDEEIDEQIWDFWQPDQAPKVEDAVADDSAPSPEEEVGREELRAAVSRAVSELPDGWRRAVVLTQMEDLPRAEVARQLGIPEDELDRRVAYADAYLRARLTELGVAPVRARAGARPPAAPELQRAFDRVLGQAKAS
jgi:RNA polymerase sigma factor (sigma-70 family)